MASPKRKQGEFSTSVRSALARRVGDICSFPGCTASTSGPHSDPSKATINGEAAHITAASPDGPRFDPKLTSAERSSPENGIWLCRNHHGLVDTNPNKYTVEEIRSWKQQAEDAQFQRQQCGRSIADQNAFWVAEIQHAEKLLDDYLPTSCLNWIARLKPHFWNNASIELRRKTLRLEAKCHFQLKQNKAAGQLFCQSGNLVPQDIDASCDIALGQYLQEQYEEAKISIKSILSIAPFQPQAWSVFIAASSHSMPYSEIFTAVPEACRSDRQVEFALGATALAQSLPSVAVKWLSQSKQSQSNNEVETAELLAQALFRELDSSCKLFPGMLLAESVRSQLMQAYDLLEEVWSAVADTEIAHVHLTGLSNLANLKFLLGDYSGALATIDEALRFDQTNDILRKQRALYLLESGRVNDARSYLEDTVKKHPCNELLLLLGACLLNEGDTEQLLPLLETFRSSQLTQEEEDRLIALRLLALLNSGQSKEAEQLFCSLPAEKQNKAFFRINYARILLGTDNEPRAKEILKEIITTKLEKLEPIQCLDIADTCFKAKLWAEAKQIYSKYLDTTRDSPGLRRLLQCYVALDERHTAFQISKSLREKYGPLQLVTRFEVSMLEASGDLVGAAEILRQLIKAFPDDEESRLSLADINVRLGQYAEADAYIQSEINWKSLPPDLICYLAQLMLRRGRGLDALEMLYQARRIPSISSNSSRLHLSYVMTFLSTEDRAGLVHEEVRPGTSFLLEQQGKKQWKTILRPQDLPPLTNTEFELESLFAKRVANCRVGDSVVIRKSPFDEESAQIIEIQSNYTRAFQEVFESFEERFGNEAGLWQVRLPKFLDGGSEKFDFSVIKKSVANRESYVHDIEQAYNNGELTLSCAALLLGGDQIAAWAHFTSNERIGFRMSSGNREELAKIQVCLLETKPKLVPDLSALLTLKVLELEKAVEELFGPLVLTQSVIDEVSQAIAVRELCHSKPHLSVSSHNGELVRTEISREEIQSNLSMLKNFEKWLRESFSVSPVDGISKLPSARVQTIQDAVGAAESHAMIKGAESCHLFYSDDLAMRHLAQNEFRSLSVSTEAIINCLRTEGIIDTETHTKKITELVGLGYRALGIDALVVVEAAVKSQFEVKWYYRSLCMTLKYAGYNHASRVSVVAHGLIGLQDLTLTRSVRLNLSFALLDSIASDWNIGSVARDVQSVIQQSTILIVPSHKEIERTIRAWIGRRSVVRLL